jgi:hypothetical protein
MMKWFLVIMTMVGGLWFTSCDVIAGFKGNTDGEPKEDGKGTSSPNNPPLSPERSIYVNSNNTGGDGMTREAAIASLEKAYVLAANDPVRKTIVVLENIAVNGPIKLSEKVETDKKPVLITGDTDKAITITRTDAANKSVIEITGGAKVAFKNLKIDGTVSNIPGDGKHNRAVFISGAGTEVTLEEGAVITGKKMNENGGSNISEAGTGIIVRNNAILVMNKGSAVTGCEESTLAKGSVMVAYQGHLTINGGEVYGNTGDEGGGVYVLQSSITINSGGIRDNTSRRQGGGIFLKESSFTMNGGYISGNRAADNEGGGVYATTSTVKTFNLYGGVIYGSNADSTSLRNTAKDNKGSALYLKGNYIKNLGGGLPLIVSNTTHGIPQKK